MTPEREALDLLMRWDGIRLDPPNTVIAYGIYALLNGGPGAEARILRAKELVRDKEASRVPGRRIFPK